MQMFKIPNEDLEMVEFFKEGYAWPETEANKEVKRRREEMDMKAKQEREEIMKRKAQQEKDKHIQMKEEEKQLEEIRRKQDEENRKRREEDEQRRKLEGRFALMLSRLQEQNTPQEYTLAGLNLGSARCRLMVNYVIRNNTLLGLHLVRKDIQDIDAGTIGSLIRENQKLEKIELEGNALGPEGIKVISHALAENTTLRFLDLEGNPITDIKKQDMTGVAALASMLKKNAKLLVLNLTNTGLKDAGELLIDALHENKTLISMDVSQNDMPVDHVLEIQRCLMENKKAYDAERLREFRERKLMNEEDAATKNLHDIEEKKKEESEIQQKNKTQRLDDRAKKYAEMMEEYEMKKKLTTKMLEEVALLEGKGRGGRRGGMGGMGGMGGKGGMAGK